MWFGLGLVVLGATLSPHGLRSCWSSSWSSGFNISPLEGYGTGTSRVGLQSICILAPREMSPRRNGQSRSRMGPTLIPMRAGGDMKMMWTNQAWRIGLIGFWTRFELAIYLEFYEHIWWWRRCRNYVASAVYIGQHYYDSTKFFLWTFDLLWRSQTRTLRPVLCYNRKLREGSFTSTSRRFYF